MDKNDTIRITIKWRDALAKLLKTKSLTVTEHNAVEMAVEYFNKDIATLEAQKKEWEGRNR